MSILSLIISEIMDCEMRWLLKRLNCRASEDHAVINVLTGSKHCWNEQGITISNYFSMHLGYIELENVCISLIWNLNTVF